MVAVAHQPLCSSTAARLQQTEVPSYSGIEMLTLYCERLTSLPSTQQAIMLVLAMHPLQRNETPGVSERMIAVHVEWSSVSSRSSQENPDAKAHV